MLRQVRQHQVYWFCRSCWEEMPMIEASPSLASVSEVSNRVRAAKQCPILVSAA